MSKRFEEYLERFCNCYNVSSENAEKHVVVMEVKKYYEDESKFNVTRE